MPTVDRYGPCATFHAGIFALGFPGTWVTTESEANEVHKYLAGDDDRVNFQTFIPRVVFDHVGLPIDEIVDESEPC